jgi:hypothetical protein
MAKGGKTQGMAGGMPAPNMFQRGMGGILPERGSQLQQQLVSQAVKSAMASAPQSGSPLLAFLTPLLGGAATSRAQGLGAYAQKMGQQGAMDGFQRVTGAGESSMELLRMMQDPNLPREAKKELKKRYDIAMAYEAGFFADDMMQGGAPDAPSVAGARRETPRQAKARIYGEPSAQDTSVAPVAFGGEAPDVMSQGPALGAQAAAYPYVPPRKVVEDSDPLGLFNG